MDAQMGQHEAMGHGGQDSGPSFLEKLADRLGAHLTARTVFGEPVERDGVTVIPVAKARMGLGGGSGTGTRKEGEGQGSGGGAGLVITPLGYIELRGGTSAFKSIGDPATFLLTIVAGSVAALIGLRGLRKLLR